MKVYIVTHEYGGDDIYNSPIIVGVFDNISKAGWTIWEKLDDLRITGRLRLGSDVPPVKDIIANKGCDYKRGSSLFWGHYSINEFEVK